MHPLHEDCGEQYGCDRSTLATPRQPTGPGPGSSGKPEMFSHGWRHRDLFRVGFP
ncbi:hypothetical protein CyaNS01_02431 [Cyanobium sp. NS01]|nr:hypothetical protein CyaNS01_02431 [Cyanobium sp. NS01]